MKKVFSILFILALAVQTSSQLWIEIAFYLNRNYIAENLCVNRFDKIPICKGSCFLEKKLNEDNDKSQKQLDLKIKDVDLYRTAAITVIEAPVIHLVVPEKYLLLNQAIITQLFSKAVFHPPCSVA
ncbi:MAG TPA: hypothetical protein VGB84_06830 [Arachidicoccus sp.]